MEICSNCFKKSSPEYYYCPYCGYPTMDIGLKRCSKGHIIYETYKNCPFCNQLVNLGKSLLDRETGKDTGEAKTEILDVKTSIRNQNPGDKTVLETDSGDRTVLEGETTDKTRIETLTGYPDNTVIENEADKTILDEGIEESLPPFFAWLVYIDEDSSPLHDIRLAKQKTVIGKGVEADIPLQDDFASKQHAVIHFEEGTFYLADLGSTNHTWLNEKKIIKEELNDGDKLRIGHQNIIFKRVRRNL